MELEVCLLGTGGVMPLPGRFLTSLWVRRQGRCMLIDCGEGTQTAMRQSGRSLARIDTILLTHLHADHAAGLPGLLLTMGSDGRRERVRLIGPPGTRRLLEAALIFAPEVRFEVICEEMEGPARSFEACGCRVDAFAAAHGVPCYGYSVSVARAGRFQADKARGLGVPRTLWSRLQAGESVELAGRTIAPELVLGPPRKGIKVTYCTDSRPVQSVRDAARGADLLILEGLYGDPAKDGRAAEKGHMTMREAAEIAAQADVPELWLTHFSPSEPEPEAYEEDVRRVFARAAVARDGMERAFAFDKNG